MKQLILVCGLPGSGKSTLAEALSSTLNVPLFSVDPIESAIITTGNFTRSNETGIAAYQEAEKLAGKQLQLGKTVIIDAVNAAPEARQMWQRLAKTHEANLAVIESFCSDETMYKQRVEARVRNMPGIPEVTWNDVVQRKQEYRPWSRQTLQLDSAGKLGDTVAHAIEFLKHV